jgi:tRNA 2-thiocytidine biosynthesis protein TtcA
MIGCFTSRSRRGSLQPPQKVLGTIIICLFTTSDVVDHAPSLACLYQQEANPSLPTPLTDLKQMWSLPFTLLRVALVTSFAGFVLPTYSFTLPLPPSGSGQRGWLGTGKLQHVRPISPECTPARVAKQLFSELASPSSSLRHEGPTPTTETLITERFKLQGKLLKQIRKVAMDYDMFEEGDHIMVCVSGGKDSATLLYLMRHLQQSLPINFQITAVHVDQHQPGYNSTSLVAWLRDEVQVPHRIVSEDTYSIVIDKTPTNKSYCTVCSRLRRGILYSTAMDLKCNKVVLGHHGDDALETLLLNMIHAGQTKSMPARYTSKRGRLAVMRPLITCLEEDIARYAALSSFPILPCNLCSSQGSTLQRPQVKLLLSALTAMSPNAKRNMLTALSDFRPSHLLDPGLRQACGMDPVTGEVITENGGGRTDADEDEDALF